MEVNKLKLMRATIYGFGSWVDDTVDFSGDSYICIYGENESGKSTLQHFILFMLFGLPPKMRSFYRPKSSSKLGGRLTLKIGRASCRERVAAVECGVPGNAKGE